MWVPYGIFVLLTSNWINWIITEHGLHHMFEVYLEDSFGIHSERVEASYQNSE